MRWTRAGISSVVVVIGGTLIARKVMPRGDGRNGTPHRFRGARRI